MRLLFLTTIYPPDIGANARIMADLAEECVLAGHDVTVVTTHAHYAAGTVTAPRDQARVVEERQGPVRVVRIGTYLPRRRTILNRAISFSSYMRNAPRAIRRLGLRCDGIVGICPPLTTGLAAHWASRATGAPWIFLIQDLYPDTAIELGYIKNPLLVRASRALGDYIHRRAAHIGVISRGFRESLIGRGVARERISVVPNWVDTERFHPAAGDGASVRRELGLEGKFVVLFAGTMGLAQGLEDCLPRAIELLSTKPEIAFVFLGGGLRKPHLEEACRRLGLREVRFLPPQPHLLMPDFLAAADAYLVHLRDIPLYRVTIPSKTYEYMAMGRPLLMGVRGEASVLVESAGAGLTFPPGDPSALADAVAALAADPERRRQMGGLGRQCVINLYSRRAVAGAFINDIERAVAAPGGSRVA